MSDNAGLEPTHSPNPGHTRRILIVGGVAGGASCAARLRRLDESVEIAIFDRGPYVAFANCGLPYYVGDVIADERRLLVASPEMFRERFNVEVHTSTEVIGIDRPARTISVRDLQSGHVRIERYDALVLSPGAAPIRPSLPGVDLPGVFAVRNIPDSRRIRSWIADRRASTAVIVGGGFIGLEMVENLIHRGLSVTVLEKLPQVMPPLDPEVAVPLMEHLIAKGVQLHLGDGLARIEEGSEGRLIVVSESGASFPANLVILAIGVRPETELAKAAGLQIGSRGGIVVDAQTAGYYPGAHPIHLKLLFSVPDGRILGAQAIGLEGVEKRVDVIATAIQFRGTVHDLAEAELCYAPQFGAAKDPVNLAGMLAENVLDGDMPVADWLELRRTDALLLDVREPDEFAGGHIPNAINLPLSQMRHRYAELPTNRDIWTYCGVGQRAYFATRFLAQHGYRSWNLSGGYTTYQAFSTIGGTYEGRL